MRFFFFFCFTTPRPAYVGRIFPFLYVRGKKYTRIRKETVRTDTRIFENLVCIRLIRRASPLTVQRRTGPVRCQRIKSNQILRSEKQTDAVIQQVNNKQSPKPGESFQQIQSLRLSYSKKKK